MKILNFVKRNSPVERIFSNTVDKDVQSMLWPLNLMQYTMFCPKYRIKNNSITPNSLISNFISMLATILFIFMYLYTNLTEDAKGLRTFMHISCYNDCLLFSCGFCMNFIIGVIQTKNNVHFVLTSQKVHRFLNNGTNIKHFAIENWIFGIMALSFYAILFTILSLQVGGTLSRLYVTSFLVSFEFNIVYAMQLGKLLEEQVSLWSIQVLNSRGLVGTQRENYYKKLFQTYVEILECYSSYKVCFQQLVSKFCPY